MRFYRQVSSRPPRAARWSEAKGEASGELVGALEWYDVWGHTSEPFDFSQMAEPELLLVIYGGIPSGCGSTTWCPS